MAPRAGDFHGGRRPEPPDQPQYLPWHWLLIYLLMVLVAIHTFYIMFVIWKVSYQTVLYFRP